MKKLAAILLLALAWSGSAEAQSTPGFVVQNPPFVPTVGQWNGYFGAKQDYFPGGIPNTSFAQAPAKTLKGNNSALSGQPVDLTVPLAQTMLNQGYILGGRAAGVSCNTAGDTAITISSPSTNWTVASLLAVMQTGAGGTARVGVYSAVSQGGTVLATQQALPAASGVNIASTVSSLTNTAGFYAFTTVYLNVGTPQGATCTVNFYVFLRPLP